MTKTEALKKYEEVAKAISKINDYKGEELDLEHLIYACSLFNPQKMDSQILKTLAKEQGWREIHKSRDCGDYIDKNNHIFELKHSVGTEGKINALQIREWQGGFTPGNKDELCKRIVNPTMNPKEAIYSLEELMRIYSDKKIRKGSWGIVWDDSKLLNGKIYEKVFENTWIDTNLKFADFAGVDYYLFIYFDLNDPTQKSKILKISHQDLFNGEKSLTNVHGTNEVNKENVKTEKALHFNINNLPGEGWINIDIATIFPKK